MDPYFGLPLWLQAETRHGWLWAYNPEHLELLRKFVQAPLRERAPWDAQVKKMTVVARLPTWIKSAKNRSEVLRAIDRIRSTPQTGALFDKAPKSEAGVRPVAFPTELLPDVKQHLDGFAGAGRDVKSLWAPGRTAAAQQLPG